MKIAMLTLIVLSLTACAASEEQASEQQEVITRNDAVEDFVKVAELEELSAIRSSRTLHHKSLSDRYIILEDGKKSYLASFNRRCPELKDLKPRPDFRSERNVLRSKFDTYRGCTISAIYALSEGQAEELLQLGDEYER